MRELYLLNVTLHVLAALVWLGGTLFFALVAAPVLRGLEPEALRARVFHLLGVRFRRVGWSAVGVLLVTGVGNLWFAGLLRTSASPAAGGGAYGRTLALKLACVGAMLVLSALHDFWLGPRAGRLTPGSPGALRARGRAAWLARLAALLGLIILFASVRLARGG